MKLEKRSGGETVEPAREERPAGKKPVVVYIMILFIVAFLLMALSFVMHQRSNTEVLGKLQSSVSALQEVQATQDKNIKLQEELSTAQTEIDALQSQVDKKDGEMLACQKEGDALMALYTLQQQYAAGDVDACLQTLQLMEDQALVELLPKESAHDVTPPSQRYQQLKEAVLNK